MSKRAAGPLAVFSPTDAFYLNSRSVWRSSEEGFTLSAAASSNTTASDGDFRPRSSWLTYVGWMPHIAARPSCVSAA